MSTTWIPAVEEESAHGVREVALRTKHLMSRRIFLEGEINAEKASEFVSQLLYFEAEAKDVPVTIYISGPGGEINSGLMIYDAIQGSKLTINMVCTGMAASMAAVIFAGGKKGRRYILPHSKVMIHEPLIAGGVGGSATSIGRISSSILETKAIINEILAKHTGRSKKDIDKATSFDNYMNAQESIDFGLCDQITESLIV